MYSIYIRNVIKFAPDIHATQHIRINETLIHYLFKTIILFSFFLCVLILCEISFIRFRRLSSVI